jgi:hypothetical protein
MTETITIDRNKKKFLGSREEPALEAHNITAKYEPIF